MLSAILFSLLFSGSAQAQDDVSDLKVRLEKLEQDLEGLKNQRQNSLPIGPADLSQQKAGLGPATSKIYFSSDRSWTLGLETQFFSLARQNDVERSNVSSFAPTFALRLNSRLLFNSQILFENGGAESSDTVTVRRGQAIVQLAYVDWLADESKQAGLRLGHQMIPIGQYNSNHDPTSYFGVSAPELESDLIPALWHENGILGWVDRPNGSVELGAFNSLNASGFRQTTFLAGGKAQGQNAETGDWMGTFRVQAKLEHAVIAGSAVFGNSAQSSNKMHGAAFQLGELHCRIFTDRFEAFAMMAAARLPDAAAISLTNSSTLAEQARGAYLQGAARILEATKNKLWIFTRYTQYNLNDRMPDGYDADPKLNKSIITSGLSYFPASTVVFKVDYRKETTAAGTSSDGLSVGLGMIY